MSVGVSDKCRVWISWSFILAILLLLINWCLIFRKNAWICWLSWIDCLLGDKRGTVLRWRIGGWVVRLLILLICRLRRFYWWVGWLWGRIFYSYCFIWCLICLLWGLWRVVWILLNWLVDCWLMNYNLLIVCYILTLIYLRGWIIYKLIWSIQLTLIRWSVILIAWRTVFYNWLRLGNITY